ncbi:MAG: replication protein RepA [Chloroflexota bacterium]|nr:replication protein RepA [Chloroflexota bacterium]PLS78847.1 MAG: replication protein [Chloroflexota bacterium]
MDELTPIDRRLLGAAEQSTNPLAIDFQHSVLCQVGMPRQRQESRVFERRSGNVHLRLEAGSIYDGENFIDQPLPYGTKPRLVMMYVAGEAIRRRTRTVDVGDSMRVFLLRLGIDTSGGKHGGYTLFKQQMQALAACRLQIGYTLDKRATTINTQPIEEFEAWVDEVGTHRTIWPGQLTLSERFYETLLYHSVPLDHIALQALKHSALALDVYTWLAHRLCRLTKPAMLTWWNLKDQFGQEYHDLKNFKKEFRQALDQVKAVYLAARIEDVEGGILLRHSEPPIRKVQM